MRKTCLAALMSATLLLAGVAGAQDFDDELEPAPPRRASSDYARNGIYVGLAWLYALELFDLSPGLETRILALEPTNSHGMSGRVGYRFHPNLATEALLEWYQKFEYETPIGGDFIRQEGINLMLNTKLFVLTGRLQPYGSLGVGLTYYDIDAAVPPDIVNEPGVKPLLDIDSSHVALSSRFGVGADFYLFRDLSVSLEAAYMLPFGALDDFRLVEFIAGAQYRF